MSNGTPVITVRAIDIEHARKELPHSSRRAADFDRYEMMLPALRIFSRNYYRGSKNERFRPFVPEGNAGAVQTLRLVIVCAIFLFFASVLR